MLKRGEITKEQYEAYVLSEIRIGLGYREGMPILEEKSLSGELKKSYDVVRPKEYNKKYTGLATTPLSQTVDSEYSVIIAENSETPRNPNKNTEKTGEVPVTYRKPREVIYKVGEEIGSDVVDIITYFFSHFIYYFSWHS